MSDRTELEANNRKIAGALRRALPSNVGFVLITYDYGKAGANDRHLAYINSGRRGDNHPHAAGARRAPGREVQLMDPRTGRIELIATEEDERDARRRGLVPIPQSEQARVFNMNRQQRRAWAREQLATVHQARQGGRSSNQRKASRRARQHGKR